MSSIGKWCVPTALAVVSGLEYVEAVEELRETKRKARPELKRVQVGRLGFREYWPAFERAGFKTWTPLPGRWTFTTWREMVHDPLDTRFRIVCLTGHMIVVYGKTMVDNQQGATHIGSRFKKAIVRGFSDLL